MSNKPYIEVNNISKIYPGADTFAVKDLSFSIDKGEIYGLLGPNGAGKTTTISILCSLLSQTTGNVSINGTDLYSNINKVRKIIGVVPQDIALYPKLTAKENLMFFGNMYGIKGRLLKNKIHYYLEYFGLINKINKRIETFSGGMKRRVNLIASILHKPEILFLDEPTVGIDVQSRNVIIEFLHELNKKGTTIVYTSHHMEEAQNLCSKIGIIDKGDIIAEGSPDQLLKKNCNCKNLEDVFLHLTGRQLRD